VNCGIIGNLCVQTSMGAKVRVVLYCGFSVFILLEESY